MSYQQQPPIGVPPSHDKGEQPPMGYPYLPQGQPAGYPPQQGYPPAYGYCATPQYIQQPPPPPQKNSSGFLNGCLAALCCCCLLDACF